MSISQRFEDARALRIILASAGAAVLVPVITLAIASASSDSQPASWRLTSYAIESDGSGVSYRLLPGTAPRLTNQGEIQRSLETAYPPLLRDAGIGGTVVLGFSVDASGIPLDVSLHESSGLTALDRAALEVGELYRFTPSNGSQSAVRTFHRPITFAVGVDGAASGLVRADNNTAPLIFVDGIRLDATGLAQDLISGSAASSGNLSALTQGLEVESVSVVQGAQAVELYGAEARNGVVRITTKSSGGN